MHSIWKIVAVSLIMYSLIAGMLVPLKPGISAVQPSSVRTGQQVQLLVEGYNTHYKAGEEKLRAWLKVDSIHSFQADKITAKDDTHLVLDFSIPAYLPSASKVKECALILDNAIDGASVLPSAVFVTQDAANLSRGQQLWKNSEIDNIHTLSGISFPFRNLLQETIRNTYYHVSLWFAMIFLLIAANIQGIKYLRTSDLSHDIKSSAYTQVALLFGVLGLVTGMVWAHHTWGAAWSNDPKQVGTAIALLIYAAYFVLRSSFDDEEQRARISAPYSIFAFVAFLLLIYMYPRMVDSLHPGNGGNPAFGGDDLDNTMRMIFYPAIIGWTLFGFWMSNVVSRFGILKDRLLDL